LALATALAALLNAGLLLFGLLKVGAFQPRPGWFGFLLRLGLGNAAMGGLLAYYAVDLPWPVWSSHERIARLALWIAVGGAGYFASLWLSGLRSAHLRLQESR
jgi:putative peptidoglycan lipid II flippase